MPENARCCKLLAKFAVTLGVVLVVNACGGDDPKNGAPETATSAGAGGGASISAGGNAAAAGASNGGVSGSNLGGSHQAGLSAAGSNVMGGASSGDAGANSRGGDAGGVTAAGQGNPPVAGVGNSASGSAAGVNSRGGDAGSVAAGGGGNSARGGTAGSAQATGGVAQQGGFVGSAGSSGASADWPFTRIDAGLRHTCGLRTNETIACWGEDSSGQISAPTGNFSQLSAGDFHSCALRSDHTVTCWGSNGNGQSTVPAGSYLQVSAGGFHTCAIRSDGSIACWGSNGSGQTTAPAGSFSQVSAGTYHSCALASNASITCWGSNVYGQNDVPPGTFSQVTAGGSHSCAIRLNGSIACWGNNTNEQTAAPVGSYSQATAGSSHTCALRTDATIACWGYNASGQTAAPEGSYTQVTAGGSHGCALRADGTIACWGDRCFPGASGCSTPTQSATCDANGNWVPSAPECVSQACVAGACVGQCEPNACDTGLGQLCSTSGQWVSQACDWGCVSGSCADSTVACTTQRSCLSGVCSCDPSGICTGNWGTVEICVPRSCSIPTDCGTKGYCDPNDHICQKRELCSSNSCNNAGTCVQGDTTYTCTCNAGFTGARCATNIDDCASNPCQNGDVCIDGINAYACTCATPGQARCSGTSALVCGNDGVWATRENCPYLCSGAGICSGECTPTVRRCSPTVTGTPQACTSWGSWVDQAPCFDSCAGGVCAGVYLDETFDIICPPAGWTLALDWQCGAPSNVGPTTAHTGTQVIATKIASNYSVNQTFVGTFAQTAPIDLPLASQPTLVFWAYIDTEGLTADGFNVKVSNNGGTSFTALTGFNPPYGLTVGGEPAWGGRYQALGYRRFLADLSAYVGQTIVLRFAFRSDSVNNYPGVYIDDVSVQQARQVPLVINDPGTPSNAVTNQPYSVFLGKTGGSTASAWRIGGGTNIAWLAIDAATGRLSGTPTATHVGPVNVTVRVEEPLALANYAERTFTFNVVAAAYVEDFEGTCPKGWTLTGDWECGTPTLVGPTAAQSGTQCLATKIAANYNFNQAYATTTATSPDINLSGLVHPTLRFFTWLYTEDGYDGFNLKIGSNAGSTYSLATIVTPAYDQLILGEQAWVGSARSGWTAYSADLTAYAGQTIRIRFAFRSDGSISYPGAYIDSISVVDL